MMIFLMAVLCVILALGFSALLWWLTERKWI